MVSYKILFFASSIHPSAQCALHDLQIQYNAISISLPKDVLHVLTTERFEHFRDGCEVHKHVLAERKTKDWETILTPYVYRASRIEPDAKKRDKTIREYFEALTGHNDAEK